MQQQQLKTKQARERLQFNQSRNVAIAFPANCEIDYEEIRMPRFIRNFQSLGNRVRRVSHEFWRAGKIDNLTCGTRYFIGKFAGQKNRRFRNSEISWPFLSFIYAAQERRVFIRREVGVESGANLRVHVANAGCAPYTRNFPPFITCSPLNQMSKSRPTQSMWVLEIQLAPVCSA